MIRNKKLIELLILWEEKSPRGAFAENCTTRLISLIKKMKMNVENKILSNKRMKIVRFILL